MLCVVSCSCQRHYEKKATSRPNAVSSAYCIFRVMFMANGGRRGTNEMNLEKMIVDHIVRASVESIPKTALDRAKVSILDTVGAMIGGSQDPITRRAFDFAAQMGGVAESHVLGVAQK